jgi:hypothetical protein
MSSFQSILRDHRIRFGWTILEGFGNDELQWILKEVVVVNFIAPSLNVLGQAEGSLHSEE